MGTGYCLGEWTVRPHRNRIERGGEVVHLAPKAMAVLDCLARASNSVVTRQELFDCAWPGADVSDDALTQRIAELRKAFGDSSHEPNIIETIPKIGFRLIPSVIRLSDEFETRQESHRAIGPGHGLKWLVPVVVGLVVVAVLVSRFWPFDPVNRDSPTVIAEPVIAVLPFENMSDDPGNEYFSDGITEELINLLANVSRLHVISRSSSFSFKGQNLKTADMARELNADLIVEGSVRKFDNHIRVTAQLIDPANDTHLFSERYDGELSDIFSLQEDIAQSIVTALQDEIGAQTVIGSRPTGNIEAYELYLQGRHYFYQRGPALDSAIMLLQMAVDKDPGFAGAWAYLAAASSVTWAYRTSISDEDALALARSASSRALELDPGLGLALAAQALNAYGLNAYEGSRDLERGFKLIDRAAVEYPDDTIVRLWAGMYTWYWGYLEEAQDHFHFAYTHDPRVGITNGSLGLVYLARGREDLAAPLLEKATDLGYPNHRHALASLSMRRGDVDAAFASLKISLTDPGTNPDQLNWIYELEAAGRAYLANPDSKDALVSVVARAPGPGNTEKARMALLFDLKDTFFEYFSPAVKEGAMWLTHTVPTLWLPEYRSYIEDPRYFDIMREDGAVEVWEQRGYLDGCIRVNDPAGDRLDCSQRYQ